MDPLQLRQKEQQSTSRKRRKLVLEGKKVCVSTNINTPISKVKPKLKVIKPINFNETVLQHENAAAGRENRKRILYQSKALAASKKVCVHSPQLPNPKQFNGSRIQPEVAVLSREKRKRILQNNKLDVPLTGHAESSSISRRLNRTNVVHPQKENSTASRDNRKRVLSEEKKFTI